LLGFGVGVGGGVGLGVGGGGGGLALLSKNWRKFSLSNSISSIKLPKSLKLFIFIS
jgi:hypothetical protein